MNNKYCEESRLAVAEKFVWQVLRDLSWSELGHSFGIVVQKVDLGPLVFKGIYDHSSYSDAKCSVDNIRDDVVIATTLQDKLTNLKDKNQSSVLDLLANNIFDICIAGHYMCSVCCKKREFVITPNDESVDDLVELEGLLVELIGAYRVGRSTKTGLLMKECKCDP